MYLVLNIENGRQLLGNSWQVLCVMCKFVQQKISLTLGKVPQITVNICCTIPNTRQNVPRKSKSNQWRMCVTHQCENVGTLARTWDVFKISL